MHRVVIFFPFRTKISPDSNSNLNSNFNCPKYEVKKGRVNMQIGRSNLKTVIMSKAIHLYISLLWSLPTVCCAPIIVQEAQDEVEPWFAWRFKTTWEVSKPSVSADSDRHSFDSISASNNCICLLQGPKEGIPILIVQDKRSQYPF